MKSANSKVNKEKLELWRQIFNGSETLRKEVLGRRIVDAMSKKHTAINALKANKKIAAAMKAGYLELTGKDEVSIKPELFYV